MMLEPRIFHLYDLYGTQVSKRRKGEVHLLLWPPKHPDISPSEHVLDIIGKRALKCYLLNHLFLGVRISLTYFIFYISFKNQKNVPLKNFLILYTFIKFIFSFSIEFWPLLTIYIITQV